MLDLFSFLDFPRTDVEALVRAVRSGDYTSVIDPAANLLKWLGTKLGGKPAPVVVGAAAPLSDEEILDALEKGCEAKTVGAAKPVGALPLPVQFILPWLLRLLGQALLGKNAPA